MCSVVSVCLSVLLKDTNFILVVRYIFRISVLSYEAKISQDSPRLIYEAILRLSKVLTKYLYL